jgi:hypothetical protein
MSMANRDRTTTRTTSAPAQNSQSRQHSPRLQFKKTNGGYQQSTSGIPNNHGNMKNSQTFVFEDLSLNMINALCAKEAS